MLFTDTILSTIKAKQLHQILDNSLRGSVLIYQLAILELRSAISNSLSPIFTSRTNSPN